MDARYWVSVIGAGLGFLAWFIKRVLDDRKAEAAQARAQANYLRALYAEIDFNTRDMEVFRQRSVSPEDLRAALERDGELVPHITDARHTDIYRARIGELHAISGLTLQKTVEFYGLLEKIRVQIEAINWASFRTISVEGRINAVDVIRRTALTAEGIGQALLSALERDNSALELRRLPRGEIWASQRKKAPETEASAEVPARVDPAPVNQGGDD